MGNGRGAYFLARSYHRLLRVPVVADHREDRIDFVAAEFKKHLEVGLVAVEQDVAQPHFFDVQ